FTPAYAMFGHGRVPQHARPRPSPLPRRFPMKRLLALLLLSLFSMGTLTACNTMAGVGEDIEAAGDKIEDEAEGHIDCDTSDESSSPHRRNDRKAGAIRPFACVGLGLIAA